MVEAVLAIGNFDGVHLGHQALLAAAARDGDRVEVVTFWPHPMRVIRPAQAPRLLCDLSERVARLNACGAAQVHVCEFTRELAMQTARQFAEEVLSPLAPRHIYVGENFRFGHGAAGDAGTLRALGFAVTDLALVRLPEGPVSSSVIRAALASGDVSRAARCLGRPFRFAGTVVRGFQRGRTLGFPTANLSVPTDRMVPGDGVYAGWLHLRGHGHCQRWPAAISVGTNPTFGDVERTVEAHVLDRDDLELYGVDVEVDFAERLRGMVRFDTMQALVAQMRADVAHTRRLLMP